MQRFHAAALRALVATQNALKQDVTLATTVGNKRFPPHEATLIANIVRRDLPYYEAAITPASVAAINAFVRDVGVLVADVPYESSRPSSAISGTDAVQSC